MRLTFAILASALMLIITPACADQINADRPGIGSSPQTVPQSTLQAEVGTDNQEIRFGVLKGFELDRDDSSWAAKLTLFDTAKFKAAFKASYDNQLHTVLEIPANYTFSPLFNLGTTVIWSRSMQTYAAEFNCHPDDAADHHPHALLRIESPRGAIRRLGPAPA